METCILLGNTPGEIHSYVVVNIKNISGKIATTESQIVAKD